MKLTPLVAAALFILATPAVSFSQQKTTLSDAEVASVAVTANQIDIDYAQIAKEKSKNQDILNFAETMAKDHKAVIGQAADLAKKLNVTPKDNAVTQSLLSDAEKTKKKLKGTSAAQFDQAYIDNEVAYHKAVIDAVKNLLIPETDNGELKSLLQQVLPALEAHLEHAQMVQKQIVKR